MNPCLATNDKKIVRAFKINQNQAKINFGYQHIKIKKYVTHKI